MNVQHSHSRILALSLTGGENVREAAGRSRDY